VRISCSDYTCEASAVNTSYRKAVQGTATAVRNSQAQKVPQKVYGKY